MMSSASMPSNISRVSRVEERDACAIIAFVDKRGQSTHANIIQTIDALRKMGHRSGDINGEGDGCGIATDIPRRVWAKRLAARNLSPHLAESSSFFVGHFLLPAAIRKDAEHITAGIRRILKDNKADLLMELSGMTRDDQLGPRARLDAPLFWQVAGIMPEANRQEAGSRLFKVQVEIERQISGVHIASLSHDTVIYKVQGVPDLLLRVFPELLDEDMHSVITLGHGRYSTNTLPTVERSQPFSILGHNGEINTIEKIRSTGRALDIEPVPGGSDSQDLNRIIEGLIHLYGLELTEALEIVFPAIYSEVERYQQELQDVYDFYRWFFPCSAQGPAAVLARSGNTIVGSVDALGLRPLWFGESDYNYFLSSEKGVVDLERTMSDPRPLAPGEKIAIIGEAGSRAEVLNQDEIQKRLLKLFNARRRIKNYLDGLYAGIPASSSKVVKKQLPLASGEPKVLQFQNASDLKTANFLAAFGWRQYDMSIRERVAHTGREVVGSMGHTGPLAALVPESLPNISDYCKENVAVVTNPAIDREREAEHFTTRVVLGSRPDIAGSKKKTPLGLEIDCPLLVGGSDLSAWLSFAESRRIAADFSTYLFEDVVDFFTCQQRDPSLVGVLDATFELGGKLNDRLTELVDEAKEAISKGAVLLVLDDSASFRKNRVFVDPVLSVAHLHEHLIQAHLRREVSLIVRSGAIRNLHDIMFLLGLGADALNPYLLWQISCGYATEKFSSSKVMHNTFSVLQKGMEKVMSTMGIHELCGYGRIFGSIGVTDEVAQILSIPNFCGSKRTGLGFTGLEEMAKERYALVQKKSDDVKIYKEPVRNPKIGKILRGVAVGKIGYREMSEELERIAGEQPIAIRHLLAATPVEKSKVHAMDQVDITIGDHAMPLVIAAMSFGSQGENSFRAYAEAAKKANIVCMNGEGGEIPDMLGKYRKNRGQQIASGRFGVYMGFLNSADFLEIKIGQGAKPGEGGHLPGNKVSDMVARSRRCKPGITLISPSNHHDIYSIEDLAQIITELKTANPGARVSVKIPVTTGIGTIAVGIAKAGADIINISGFEGGTGAAREHAKRYVGMPAEIGVSEAHRALVESGLRKNVELWADGGMRSGDDVLKMVLLGANRVGMGTVALMGVGCISCRRCHLDTCPRGISTQLRTKEDAEARGVKAFTPRVFAVEAENLARLLTAIGDEIKMRLAALGEKRLQDLVGRTDLLRQVRLTTNIDTAEILKKPAFCCDPEEYPRSQIVRKPLNYLTKLISDLAMERFEKGENTVYFEEEHVRSTDRAVGTYLAGAIERRYKGSGRQLARLRLNDSVPGNGLCAFISHNLETVVEGGSQDGAAKGSIGGILGVFKGQNLLGQRIDGSTGKSFAYGAIGGLVMVQNMADSRACIRMSGADVIFGARITRKIQDGLGNIASRAHLKGFAFEYMTGGRAVVLGDPGPWICAGMTGGTIYQCLYPEFGFDKKALERRLSRGANVSIKPVSKADVKAITALLDTYVAELTKEFQSQEAAEVMKIVQTCGTRFLKIVPKPLTPPSAE